MGEVKPIPRMSGKYHVGQWLWTDGYGNHSNPAAICLLSCDWDKDAGVYLWRALAWNAMADGTPMGVDDPKAIWEDSDLDRLKPYPGPTIKDGRMYFPKPTEPTKPQPVTIEEYGPGFKLLHKPLTREQARAVAEACRAVIEAQDAGETIAIRPDGSIGRVRVGGGTVGGSQCANIDWPEKHYG